MAVGESGLSRGPSTGVVNWDVEVVAEKGPVVEVVVLTGDSVSELVSRGRLSLRNRLRTRELLERLWVGLSVMLVAIERGMEERVTTTRMGVKMMNQQDPDGKEQKATGDSHL